MVDLVVHYRTALASTPIERHMFDVLLANLGVDLDDPFYAETCFVLQRRSIFRIDESFPCIRSSTLPSTVTKVRYDLNVRGLKDWSIDEGTVDDE